MTLRGMCLSGIIAAVIIIIGCNTSNNSDNSDNPSGTFIVSYSYSIKSDSLVFSYPAGDFTYCNGSTLVSSHADSTATYYKVIGNNLCLFYDDPETLSSNASTIVIREYSSCLRVGGGSGLAGVWKDNGVKYDLLAGSVTPGVIYENHYGESVDLNNLYQSSAEIEYQFSENKFSVYYQSSFYDIFLDDWNSGEDSSYYAITVTKVNSSSVKLSGRITTEVVTISSTKPTCGDKTYSSNIPAHTTGIYYYNPLQCPNAPPAWYWDFMSANTRYNAAKTLIQKKQKKNVGQPGFFFQRRS
jgi:hypothetical protein